MEIIKQEIERLRASKAVWTAARQALFNRSDHHGLSTVSITVAGLEERRLARNIAALEAAMKLMDVIDDAAGVAV